VLVAEKEPERRSRFAVRWLRRLLEEDESLTIEEATMAASCLRRSAGRRTRRRTGCWRPWPKGRLGRDGLERSVLISPANAEEVLVRPAMCSTPAPGLTDARHEARTCRCSCGPEAAATTKRVEASEGGLALSALKPMVAMGSLPRSIASARCGTLYERAPLSSRATR
jgi:hypothetical protein